MTSVVRYRKKPVTVETMAFDGTAGSFWDLQQFTGKLVEWNSNGLQVFNTEDQCWISVPEGHSIVKGKLGEFYPISPAALADTYEAVDE